MEREVEQQRLPGEDDLGPFRSGNAQRLEEQLGRACLGDIRHLLDEALEMFLGGGLPERGLDERPSFSCEHQMRCRKNAKAADPSPIARVDLAA